MATSAEKIREAEFFLELMDAVDGRNCSLTDNSKSAEEMSYLFSALMNSVYAALEHARPALGKAENGRYKRSRDAMLGYEGVRNVTTHERHISPDYAGYIPPAADNVNFRFVTEPRLVREKRGNSCDIELDAGISYYVEIGGVMKEICELCSEEIKTARRYLRESGVIAQQIASGDV